MMHRFALILTTILAAATATATAQACAYTKASSVDPKLDVHLKRDCGSAKIRFGGLEWSTTQTGCPLLATYTPKHEIVERVNVRTQTVVTGISPVYLLSFKCVGSWLIVIPLSNDCRLDQSNVAGFTKRLVTVACPTVVKPATGDLQAGDPKVGAPKVGDPKVGDLAIGGPGDQR
ncbi:MAG: hypothetical protein AB8H80_06390 [Planctomycetota bacterium]